MRDSIEILQQQLDKELLDEWESDIDELEELYTRYLELKDRLDILEANFATI